MEEEKVRLSPSAITLHLQCPRKFYYRHIEKIPEKPSPFQIRGRIVHKVLEKFFDLDFVEKAKEVHWHDLWHVLRERMFELLSEEWKKIGSYYIDCFSSSKQKEEMLSESREFLDFYSAKLSYALYNKLKEQDPEGKWFEENIKRHFFPKHRELKLEIESENIVGFIDKTLSLFGKGIAIVDYKTSKSSLPHSISAQDLKQCKAYAFLWKKFYGEMPKFISIFYLRDGESVYYPISEKDFKEIEEDIEEIRGKGKEKENFRKNPTKLCNYCDFFPKCFSSREQFEEEFALNEGSN